MADVLNLRPQGRPPYGSMIKWQCLILSDSVRPHGQQPTRLLCPWGFSRQEYWSGLPCPPPGDLPNPGIEPGSLIPHALASRFFTTSAMLTATGHYFSLLYSIPFVCLYNMANMEMRCLDTDKEETALRGAAQTLG